MLVIIGHVIEYIQTPLGIILYKFIYLFHMPLFIFISGFFAKFDIKKIVRKLLFPFLIFQLIYILFEVFVLNVEVSISYFLKPRWILWYMFAMIFWKLSIFLIDKAKKYLLPIIILSTLTGLAIGFIPFDGYILSISRMIVFYPYFLLGYYFKQTELLKKEIFSRQYFKLIICICSLISIIAFFFIFPNASKHSLYMSTSYNFDFYNSIWLRLYTYICATLTIIALFVITTNKKTIFSFMGEQSFSLYIAHAPIATFLAVYIAKIPPYWDITVGLTAAVCLTALLVYVTYISIRHKKLCSHNK